MGVSVWLSHCKHLPHLVTVPWPVLHSKLRKIEEIFRGKMFLSQAILRTRLFIIQILSVALSQGYLMVPVPSWYQQLHQRPSYSFIYSFPPVRSPLYILPRRGSPPKYSANNHQHY